MAVSYLAVSTVCMFASFLGLQWWAQILIGKFKDDGLTVENFAGLDDTSQLPDLLLSSSATVLLLATFIVSVFTLVVLLLKTFFFGELSSSESRKLLERLVNYVIYKGTFLPLVLPPTLFHLGLWSSWLTVLCTLKMFQALARDRLERLNASPMTTPWVYFRVYSVLLAVLTIDIFWIRMSLIIHRTLGSSIFLLLLFEPFSVAFETLQAMVVHGFQLLDIWVHHSAGESNCCRIAKFIDISAAGVASFCLVMHLPVNGFSSIGVVAELFAFSNVVYLGNGLYAFSTLLLRGSNVLLFWISRILYVNLCSLLEWKSFLMRNLGFLLDMATLLTAIGHYAHIWMLRGMPLHIVDVVLFLNIRALLSAIIKRTKGYIKLKMALGALHAALPDATFEELQAYNDECAICRLRFHSAKILSLQEPMAKAKRLHCNHLFHLGCLRSWLDQGLNEVYSCPTCRKPLFVPSPVYEASINNEVLADEQLARRLSSGLDGPNPSGVVLPGGLFPNQAQIPLDGSAQRNPGLNTNWLSRSVDGAGPSTSVRSAGLSRVQLMMRHLASVGESYTQPVLDDTAWGLWPANISQPAASVGGLPGSMGGLHVRRATLSASDEITNILSMAETVREVLPHVPDEIIFQDLLRTNSATVTVNNLL